MPRKKPVIPLPPVQPWKPALWENEDVGALQAVARGLAQPHQQIRALKYIVEIISGCYEGSYRTGEDGRRDTDFAEGKRFVGLQVVKLVSLNLGLFKDGPSEQG